VFAGSYRPLFAYVWRRIESRELAEEIVAEVYLVAWRRIGEMPHGAESLPWLIAVARRIMANARRGEVRRDRLVTKLGQQSPSPSEDIDRGRAASELGKAINAALGRLRPDHAELLRLAAWDGLPHAQIAVVLGCSVNAVAIRLHRARRAFGVEFEKASAHSGHVLVTDQTPATRRRTNGRGI
jgi:RNA polymerase sigma-70 factor (ECF subfamily)